MGLKLKKWTRFPRKHPIKTSIAAPFVLSASIQLTPQIASDPSEEYLHDSEYPQALSEHFNTDNIRVYDRWSPLSSLHTVGRPVGKLVNNYPDDWGDAALETVFAPLEMLLLSLYSLGGYVLSSDVDAYAVPDHDGTCFVRPPAKNVDLKDALSSLAQMSRIEEADTLTLEGDEGQIEDVFRTIIMAHEMQHCEQPAYALVEHMRESDADIVALQLLSQAGYTNEVIEEASKLYLAARLLGGLGGSENHDTGMNIISGHTVTLPSYKIRAAQRILNDLTEMGVSTNDFPDDMSDDEKYLHMIMRLNHSGVLNEFEPEVSEYARIYTQAYFYMNKVTNEALLDEPDYFSVLNIDFISFATGIYDRDFQGLDPVF